MKNSHSWGARWILPVDRPPIENGSLTVVDGLITAIESGTRGDAEEDLGEVALMPLLVNAHTHLEFSSLPQPLGHPGMVITDWISEVIGWRAEQNPSQIMVAIALGLRESLICGSTGLGEISSMPWFRELALSDDILVRCFVERLGSRDDETDAKIVEARGWLESYQDDDDWFPGISPHAPYSLCDSLFEGLIDWATAQSLPVAMHIAESREELQFLDSGEGSFRHLLERMNLPIPTRSARLPMHYLKALARTKHALVIHGNYLKDEELDFVAGQSHMHVVFCPRTHAYFEHDPYPLRQMLDRNINVAVGTDSRASSPDLNLLSELQQIRRTFPDVSPHKILEMGTLAGARALQFDHLIGSLTSGKRGEFLTVPLDSPHDDPLEYILENAN